MFRKCSGRLRLPLFMVNGLQLAAPVDDSGLALEDLPLDCALRSQRSPRLRSLDVGKVPEAALISSPKSLSIVSSEWCGAIVHLNQSARNPPAHVLDPHPILYRVT